MPEKKIHFHSHMSRNFVKVGDRVVKYKTRIGTIGNANSRTSWNNMYAHDHFGISVGLTVDQVLNYIYGWDKKMVASYYLNPHKEELDWEKMYPDIKKVDVGNRGYDFLQSIKNSKGEHRGFHPAVDVNNSIGGDSDFGEKIMASCTGKVIYEWRGWTSNRGWGNVIFIAKDEKDKCKEQTQKVEKYQDKLEKAIAELNNCIKLY